MRHYLVASVLIAAGLAGMGARAAEKELEPGSVQATLTTAAPNLKRGGSVLLQLELRNASSAPLSIYRHISGVLATPGYVIYHLTRVGGGPVDVMQPIDEHPAPPAEDYQRLEPGELVTHELLFTSDALSWEGNAIIPGRHTLTVEVIITEEGRAAGVADAWAGTLRSNPVTIEVTE